MANIVSVTVGGQSIRTKTSTGQSVNVSVGSLGTQNVNISPGAVAVIGKSPYINDETGTWMVYNDKTRQFEDSGVVAESPFQEVSEEFVIDENGVLCIYEVPAEKVNGLSDLIGDSIRGVSADGTILPVLENIVNIPIADDIIAGLVRSSGGENNVTVNADGTMTVDSLNVNRLTQTVGERFTLNAGTSTD